MLDNSDIERLISQVAMGDRKAFSRLYDATSAKLMGVCLRLLQDRSAADDALQDTYVKVWKNAKLYTANGLSPMTWLITIARNTSIDKLRQSRTVVDFSEVDETIATTGFTPEQSAIASSEAKRIAQCLDELESDRQDAVKAVYLDGQSYKDLSQRFDVPLNTIRTWLRRALISLRECMQR